MNCGSFTQKPVHLTVHMNINVEKMIDFLAYGLHNNQSLLTFHNINDSIFRIQM